MVNSIYDLNGDTQWEYHTHCPYPRKEWTLCLIYGGNSMLKEHLNAFLTYHLSKLLGYMCCQAIADLSKALEFEPNSSDILHERGTPFIFC